MVHLLLSHHAEKIAKVKTDKIKTKINREIEKVNAVNEEKLPKISGHFSPGYIYGNPKIHKNSEDTPL